MLWCWGYVQDMESLLDIKLFPVNKGGYIHDQEGDSNK